MTHGPGEEKLRAFLKRYRPQTPPPPEGLPGNLCDRLETAILSIRNYDTAFIDNRLYPWRNSYPRPDRDIDKARAIIDYLFSQYNAEGDNALYLLLIVLAERSNPHTQTHNVLCKLATEVLRYV